MKKLMSVFLVLALILAGAVSALGEAAADQEVEITRNMIGDGKNVLRIVMDGEPFSVTAMQEVLTKFFEKTGISVELMFVPSSGGWAGFNSKIQTMIAGGDTPDVIRLAIEGFEVFRSNGLIEPLNPYIEKYPEWAALVEDNNEKISKPLTVDGTTYAYGFEWNNIVTHINLNDQSIEGIRVKGKKAFSVQYHPESSPGPHDSRYLFDDFVAMLKK
jgi:ABC-type glycerol-3-phosphate transport system substrate-binding protein